MNDIVAAKVKQSVQLLNEFDIPVWIAQFGRETYEHPEPVQHLVVGTSVTWPAAFIIEANGRTTAIVGTGDASNVRDVGAYETVVGYVQDVGPHLRETLERCNPAVIGLSYSRSDDSADNLTHGMYLMLEEILRETPFLIALTPADSLLGALRARKLGIEVDRIKAAIGTTLGLFDGIEHMLRPGITEREVFETVQESIRDQGIVPAWDPAYDPVINFGGQSKFGHAAASEIALEPGMLVHVDLGVKQLGYCSDLQRMWYVLSPDETAPPDEVQDSFAAVKASIEAGFRALKPGVPGWTVDAEARSVLVGAGYEEPQFSLGHQLGQSTHDGGALLGPRWPRYGSRPDALVEQGHVYTLEYGVVTSRGMMALEEDVVVTATGAEYLCEPQTELKLLRL